MKPQSRKSLFYMQESNLPLYFASILLLFCLYICFYFASMAVRNAMACPRVPGMRRPTCLGKTAPGACKPPPGAGPRDSPKLNRKSRKILPGQSLSNAP